MKTTLRQLPVAPSLLACLIGLLLAAPVIAKLPPTSDEAKAKAAEAASKSAWGDKVAAFQLCNVMNKVAAGYHASAKEAGKATPTPIETPACADPGAYVPMAAAVVPVAAPAASAPPLEASGAHSPPATALGPPSGKATEAEIKGGVKK